LAIGLGAGAAPAHAARSTQIGMADDALLLRSTDARAVAAVNAWARLGVDVVRIHAVWSEVAPAARARQMPAGFDPRNPNSPGYNWARLDRAISLVRERGMRVMLVVTGPGPVWGSQQPSKGDGTWKPHAGRFAAFASAVAQRYSSSVNEYIIWNEPNQRQWMTPQWSCRRGRCSPVSPYVYRAIVLQAGPAIRSADPGARVLIGALAPRGAGPRNPNDQMRPLIFLRTMACVNTRYKRVRSGPCRGFTAPVADGFATHAHGVRNSPSQPSRNPNDVQLSDMRRLEGALDRVQRAGGMRKRGGGKFGIWIDEYGYQTNPPDKYIGVSPRTQNRYLQEAAYRVWSDSRIHNLTQYVYRDEPYNPRINTWQSGLLWISGRAKPSLAGFRAPFWPVRIGRSTVRFWGQVRPGGATTVQLQRRSGHRWKRLRTMRTDAHGAFLRKLHVRGKATLRFTWPGGKSDAWTV